MSQETSSDKVLKALNWKPQKTISQVCQAVVGPSSSCAAAGALVPLNAYMFSCAGGI
jgi:hypothetical protein